MSARLPGGDLGGDVLAAVVLFGSVEVVGPAAESKVRGRWRPAQSEGVKVVNLELVAGGAAVAGAADERALTSVAPPYLIAYGCVDVAAARWRHAWGGLLARAAAPPVCVRQDRTEPLVQNLRQLSARQLVRQSPPSRLQVRDELGAHRHPQDVLLRGNRVQPCCRRASDLNRSSRRRDWRRQEGRRGRERRVRALRCSRCRAGTSRIIPGTWQPAQQVGGGGLRPQAGHELLDLVFRSPGSTIEDFDDMCFVEHVTELDEGREVQSPIGQIVGTRCTDPVLPA